MYPLDNWCQVSCIRDNRDCIFDSICPIKKEIVSSFESKRRAGVRRYIQFNGRQPPHVYGTMASLDDLLSLFRVYLKTGCVCYYCGKKMQIDTQRIDYMPDLLTIDHRIPLVQGGSHTIDNLLLCCYDCNIIKSQQEDPHQIVAQQRRVENLVGQLQARWGNAT
jgi:5-methylcytosine-specific restriction endonuclease McrA